MIECILRKKERKIRSRTNCPKKHVRTKHETEKPKTPIGVLLEIIVQSYRLKKNISISPLMNITHIPITSLDARTVQCVQWTSEIFFDFHHE